MGDWKEGYQSEMKQGMLWLMKKSYRQLSAWRDKLPFIHLCLLHLAIAIAATQQITK